MRTFFLVLSFVVPSIASFAQVKSTNTAYVSFYSELEDVKAENYAVVSDLDPTTGKLNFSLAVQSFYFDNATMQKHFNEEDVMHSRKFPRASFSGDILNNSEINYTQDGTYTIQVKGNLTMKGTTNAVETKATLEIKGGKMTATANFKLDRFQYGVTGKDGVISQLLDISVKAIYE